jgi:hypothetical protein
MFLILAVTRSNLDKDPYAVTLGDASAAFPEQPDALTYVHRTYFT